MAFIYRNPIRPQFEHAKRQRAMLDEERQRLNDQIATLDSFILAMAPLVENDPGQSLQQKSLADLCRIALDAYGQWVTAQQVRQYLAQLGIELEYQNPMAVLHTTLQRVGQVGRDTNGTTCYAKKGIPPLGSPWAT
jgi:hypothetical protein